MMQPDDAAGRVRETILNSGKKQQTIYEFSGVVDKIEYRNAAGTLVGTDDFTYNDLLRRTAATSRYGINKKSKVREGLPDFKKKVRKVREGLPDFSLGFRESPRERVAVREGLPILGFRCCRGLNCGK